MALTTNPVVWLVLLVAATKIPLEEQALVVDQGILKGEVSLYC
jgi:hypothetical protein